MKRTAHNPLFTGHYSKIKGVASLPVVLVLAVLILAVGVGITAMSFSESIISAGQKQSSSALMYAETGARDALMKIARNKDYNTPTAYQIAFISGGCSTNEGCATITVNNGSAPKIIVSEGSVNNSVRKIQVDVYFDSQSNGEIQSVNWKEIVD